MESLNRIEKTYQRLLKKGITPFRFFEANPSQSGILFPADVLKEAYLPYLANPVYKPLPKGLVKARQAISNYYEEHKLVINPENIILTSGSSESFFYLFSLLCQPGDAILAPQPSYPLFDSIAKLAHITLQPYQLIESNFWQPDLDFLKTPPATNVKAIALISPHNPTGCLLSEENLHKIVTWANKYNLALICDEVFSEFIFEQDTFPRLATTCMPNLCFTLNGLSKMMALPSFKLSWILVTGHTSLVEDSTEKLSFMTDTFLTCHTGIQEALPLLFEKAKPFLTHYKNEVAARRKIALNILDQAALKYTAPQGGFYLSLPYSRNISDEELILLLLNEYHLFVHPGYFYDFQDDQHIVFSFLHETEQLKSALKTITKLIS